MGDKQSWNTDSYQNDAGFVSVLGAGVVEWLDPKSGERILDLGCGDGVLTKSLIEAGADVVGVDASESFVETAIASGIDARLMDGQALDFDHEFDAVFTSAALHWMLEPEKVISGVVNALKPGGRFVGEFGAFGNVAAIITAMRAVGRSMGGDVSLAYPWFFPTVAQYSALLEKHGFAIDEIISFARPTPVPNGIKPWLSVMCGPFFRQFGGREDEAYDLVIDALKPSLQDFEGNWTADYVRLRFRAHL
ncbi:MAG: methyltransferase domain-containing protein [Rhizobiaceae bacterium]|nr:methyltransferase domain-containing protein [Rhizobiaceae bacterium]